MLLILLDGHAILHRAFHALPPMTNKFGMQTNAVYGFTTMLLQILDSQKPDYLVVAFDLPAPTFRQQLYVHYQAKRPEMVGSLVEQIPLVHELLDALKVQYFEVAGFEADDVIGTLATQVVPGSRFTVHGKKNGSSVNSEPDSTVNTEVIIVTGDRDMLQLIDDHTKVCVPIKGLIQTKIYDEKLVKGEFGVDPSQWVDVKALKGDASDNYPGVRGIGPKTAQDLIAQYGTLEEVYKNLGKLNPKIAKKLAEGAEGAGMSKRLATIVTDVPVHLDLERAAVMGIDWNEGVKYMREKLGFKSIPEKIEKVYLKKTEAASAKSSGEPRQLELI